MSLPRTPITLYVCLLVILAAVPEAVAQSIPVARADVDRNCTVTVADANIVKAQLGKRTGQAGFNPNADVDQNGVVNNIDVTFVTRNVGKNVCAPPPAAPTIVATVAPPANANGWHNTAATVSFACTNAVTCPAAVTVAGEGAAQVVARTVANSAGVTATASVTLNIDVTAPVLVATAPATVVPGAVVVIPVTATDLSGVARTSLLLQRAIVASRTATPFDLTYTMPAATVFGTQDAFEIVAEDRAGNTASVRRPFTVQRPDTTNPTVSIGAPTTAGPGATVPLTVRAADDAGSLGRVRVTRADAPTPTLVEDRTAGSFNFQVLGQIPATAAAGAVITFVAVATDASGNTMAASADVQVVTSVTTQTLQITVDPPVSPTFQTDGVVTGTIGRGTTVTPPTATPIVAALSPASGGQGQTVDITITGVNTTFGPLTQVNLGTGVFVQSVSVSSPTTVVARAAIAPNASIGPRIVAVSTGREEALLPTGFVVVSGAGRVTGRVVTPTTQVIANAQVCQPTGTSCTPSASDGTFTAAGVPTDVSRLVVSASGFDTLSVAVALTPNGTSSVGDVVLIPANQPPPPPLPNSPPVTPQLATVLGRGATDIGVNVNPDQLRVLVRDTVLAVGGREIGILDAAGQQLNPRMIGAGYASLTDAAVEDIAQEMAFGNTMSLAQLLTTLANSITLPGVKPPTLGQLLTAFQARVDAAWQNPNSLGAPLVMALFNQGRVASPTPPRINFDTELNPLQTNLMAVSFMTFVTRYLPEGAAPPYAHATPVQTPGFMQRAGAALAAMMPRFGGAPALSVSGVGPGLRGRGIEAILGRGRAPLQQSVVTANPDDNRPASVMWRTTYESILGQTGMDTAKKFGKVCDGFLVSVATGAGEAIYPSGTPQAAQAATDPYAKFLPQPDCKTVLDLLSILGQSGEKSYASAAKTMKGYYAGVAATRDMGKVIDTYYSTQSQKDAFAAVKAEARNQQIVTGLTALGASLVTSTLTKLQGLVVDKLVQFEAQLVIDSLRPRQPFISKIEQLKDPTFDPAVPTHYVKITFSPSPNDKGAANDPAVAWRYRLYRGKAGLYSPVAMKVFKPGEAYFFADLVPGDGTYSYVVIGVRQIGVAINDPPPTNQFLEFVGGFFDTTVKIGAEGAKRAVFGINILNNLTAPTLQIMNGIRYQTSDPSAPALLWVSTAPPTPKPPASLAVWGATGITFVSVPKYDRIFVVSNGTANLLARPNFKAPGAVGLGISGNGTVYTDNAASDAQFGGRIFSFAIGNGARALAGTVNYFSQLLMFANPVSVQAMTVATGPFGANVSTVHEESLFIADAQNQRITRMVLPSSLPANYPIDRNVSQPWVSSPLFNFGADTAMAMSGSYRMAITQGNNLLFASPAGPFAPPTGVQQLFASGAPSPYTTLSGVTFDGRTNLYVSDSVQGTLSMIPAERSAPNNGLFGLSAVDRKKLIITRGLLRPTDVKLSSARDGLVFFDTERMFAEVRFGMSGQVVSDTGTPLAGAIVHVPALRRVETTDSDGVFTMPDLVKLGTSPVVDFTVLYQGQTRSYSRVLDTFTHNIVDVTFKNVPPPIPPDPPTPPTVNPPPPPATRPKPDPSVTVSVEFDLDPTAPPATPPSTGAATSCPRGVILSPGFGASTTNATVTVNGLVSNRWAFGQSPVPDAFLIVNGVPFPVSLSGLEFSTTAVLSKGDNTLVFALPARVLKPLGCAPATAADTDPISISGDHRVFHDPLQAEVDAFRIASGWDIAARAIVRTGGVPLAGLDFIVPGTGETATTDGDGVAQINLSKSKMGASAASADQLAAGLFNDVGRAVASLRADQLAPSLATLQAILATTVGATNAPASAAKSATVIASNLVRLQGIVTTLIDTLRALQPPAPADIAALEAIGLQLAGTSSGGEIVIRARDYPRLTITVKVQ